MKSGSNEKNLWLVSKAKRNVQDPVSRIVGFESSGTGSFINGFERLSTDRGNTSSNIGVSDNLVDVHGLQVRKRLLSPLNGMLSPRQFNGDHLDLNNIFTRAVTVSPEKVNSPLSLSPLGPRWSERMKNAEYFRVAVKDGEHCISKNMGVLLDESAPRISHSPNADERGISASNCQDIGMLGSDIEKLTPQSCPETGSKWGPESIPLPQCVKLVRSLSGASVRRSLVGSFEESLLSGRFSSGKANQRIDGFLAVLNVTGGNFIPPSQKLPFSVTSIDGDSCLLYYASIDLAGNLPSNKGRGKLKRSLSNDESRSAKSRLRVPMKGRIQLVLSNPEKTPLHTFLCSYDLSDMPAGTKTFMRQKVNLASCSSTLDPMEREKITDMKNGRTPTMLNACHSLNKKLVGSSLKVNENSAGAGALRYALHLRFLCPSAKKSSRSMQRCKSDPFAAPHTNTSDDERRFYLYNDLRVVFPQRHSDADEGKLIVEQHFPADPKYFDISN
ncbi:hypothetical protein QJS04_geneDACA020886 [Acorus gramineus]|uniref:Atos-like conserved domain-containing protein n=1 Tax=Acorus gramineus TaxID=55184 RepID=A0AAV9B1S8_ACOGR|nr:hypothetical protein QJS04_geneDACA020886 [Acorus gramineus]